MKKWLGAIGLSVMAVLAVVVILTFTGHLRIFWQHARSDDEEAQIGLVHYYPRAPDGHDIPSIPLPPADVYFGQFGGKTIEHWYVLLALPKECSSARYILNRDRVLVPDGGIWTVGQFAFWWQPSKIHELPYSRPEDKPSFGGGPTYDAFFKSPSCGPIHFHLP